MSSKSYTIIIFLLLTVSSVYAQLPTPTVGPGCMRIPGTSLLINELQTGPTNCHSYPVPFPPGPPGTNPVCWNDTGACDMTVNKHTCPPHDGSLWGVTVGFMKFVYTIPSGSTITSGTFEFTSRHTIENGDCHHTLMADCIDPVTFCSAANWSPSGPGAAGSIPICPIVVDGITLNQFPISQSCFGTTQGAIRFTISGGGVNPVAPIQDIGDVEIQNQCGTGSPPNIVLCFITPTPTIPPPTPTITLTPTATPTLTPTNTHRPTPTPAPTCIPCNGICQPDDTPTPCGCVSPTPLPTYCRTIADCPPDFSCIPLATPTRTP